MQRSNSWFSLVSTLLRTACPISEGLAAELLTACRDKVGQGISGSAVTSAGDLILEMGKLPELIEGMRGSLVASCNGLPLGMKRSSVLRNLHAAWGTLRIGVGE
jgi:hypothetical protein